MPSRIAESGSHGFPQQENPLQVAKWSGKRETVTSSGASQLITLSSGATLVEISAVEAVYLEFGGAGAVATSTIEDDASRIFLAGVQVVPVPLDSSGDPYTHVAVLQVAVAGIVQVEMLD